MTDPIYHNGYTDTASSKALRLYSLARVGIASTDSYMNVNLAEGGYCELFEVIGRLAYELSEDCENLERIAKVGPIYGPKGKSEADAAISTERG